MKRGIISVLALYAAVCLLACSKQNNPASPPPPEITETATPDGKNWQTSVDPLETPAPAYGEILVFDREIAVVNGKTSFFTSDMAEWVTGTADIPQLQGAAYVSSAGVCCVLGGYSGSGKNRVFSSDMSCMPAPLSYGAKGLAAKPEAAGFEPRAGHAAAYFGNGTYVTGGYNGKKKFADCHVMNRGKWEQIRIDEYADYGAREGHAMAAFKGRLYVAGGEKESGLSNDVWFSENGADWEMLTDNAAFTPRKNHTVLVFKERMWIIGGEDKNGPVSDVWWSVTGDFWVKAADGAAFGTLEPRRVFVFDGRMWVAAKDEGGRVKFWHAK